MRQARKPLDRKEFMASRHNKSALALSMFWMAAALSSAQGQVSPASAGGKTVALSPGSCASVASGDLITLTWNPGFSPAVSGGLHGMTLVFAQGGSILRKDGLPRNGFVLWTLAAKPKPGNETPIVALQNGFFLATFRADLGAVRTGQYTLIEATAEPELDSAAGEPPVMTNSPKNEFFCLEVTGIPAGKR